MISGNSSQLNTGIDGSKTLYFPAVKTKGLREAAGDSKGSWVSPRHFGKKAHFQWRIERERARNTCFC
jgi:hypothetical protein